MDLAAAWETRRDGPPMSQGRVVGRSPGWLSLMGLLLVAGLRKAVAADSCQNGSDETMSPHHHGDLVGWEEESRRRKRLLVWEAPGLSRVGPPNLTRVKKCPVATRGVQALEADSPSSTRKPLGEDNMAGTAWPVTCHGGSPGMSTSMDSPPLLGP